MCFLSFFLFFSFLPAIGYTEALKWLYRNFAVQFKRLRTRQFSRGRPLVQLSLLMLRYCSGRPPPPELPRAHLPARAQAARGASHRSVHDAAAVEALRREPIEDDGKNGESDFHVSYLAVLTVGTLCICVDFPRVDVRISHEAAYRFFKPVLLSLSCVFVWHSPGVRLVQQHNVQRRRQRHLLGVAA